MRSGNGRHRRPRQAPAIFVTAGVTGAGIALPLLGASGAHAADTATWDKVAQCESAGVWSSASGNGYYGGLQLTQEMWDNYGGSAYASRPDLASRAQQIAVAESILDDRGPDVWPSCAVNAGLTKDGRAPKVNPGSTATPQPDPSDAEGSSDPWDRPDASDEPDGSDSSGSHDGRTGGQTDGQADGQADGQTDEPSGTTPSPSAPDDSDSAGSGDATQGADRTPEPSGSTKPGEEDGDASHSADPADGGGRTDNAGIPDETPAKGKHRGDAGDEGDGDRSSGGRHASRGDDAHRTGPAADGDYTVRPGDSLSAIAQAHRLPGGWPALYERNEGVVGSDADLIKPGQLLDLGHKEG
ncbi:LysM peptidoglycan-binding domain-containing protein [Streptomyces inhibens]|uniref:LysM peptidoglycan-binding domain-containing protein n=1 Tax=Streptomyces inhibens TaxID=2293571 RepID=A0A371Q9X3_STRIH|nr:LysM peptidoglycan-binding domain-containing protein [Streptomyces inhibens]